MSYMTPTDRPPLYTFIDKEMGEDREKSDAAGYFIPKSVTFIQITPHGHKGDPMEFIADEFIARKKVESDMGRYEGGWVRAFEEGLKNHLSGKESVRDGASIMSWERIPDKNRRKALSNRFPTVEDLAATPDSGLDQIGLDGRYLRDMARGDVQSKKDLSPVVRELADANDTIRKQQEQIDALVARMDALAYETPRAGRPRKDRESA